MIAKLSETCAKEYKKWTKNIKVSLRDDWEFLSVHKDDQH